MIPESGRVSSFVVAFVYNQPLVFSWESQSPGSVFHNVIHEKASLTNQTEQGKLPWSKKFEKYGSISNPPVRSRVSSTDAVLKVVNSAVQAYV